LPKYIENDINVLPGQDRKQAKSATTAAQEKDTLEADATETIIAGR
jgi:hypothetical protein